MFFVNINHDETLGILYNTKFNQHFNLSNMYSDIACNFPA